MSHTPGPWHIRFHDIEEDHNHVVASDYTTPIALVETGEDDGSDAQLIAAAPELLIALHRMLLLVEYHNCIYDMCSSKSTLCPIQAGRVAITRATGFKW